MYRQLQITVQGRRKNNFLHGYLSPLRNTDFFQKGSKSNLKTSSNGLLIPKWDTFLQSHIMSTLCVEKSVKNADKGVNQNESVYLVRSKEL